MIKLRPVEAKDQLFIEAVFRSSREAELALTNWTEQQKSTFIVMQSMAQLADYKMRFPMAEYQIITFKKKDAGRWYTWESDAEIRILDITILPEFRGKKIGSFLLKQIIEKGNNLKKKVTLHVLKGSPAYLFYQRLGFATINETGSHFYMEKRPR